MIQLIFNIAKLALYNTFLRFYQIIKNIFIFCFKKHGLQIISFNKKYENNLILI